MKTRSSSNSKQGRCVHWRKWKNSRCAFQEQDVRLFNLLPYGQWSDFVVWKWIGVKICWQVSEEEVAQSVPTLCDPMGCTWNYLVQNTRVGSLSLLQGIFPTQGLNPGFPHCRQILYQLNHKGSPRILKWVTYPFPSLVDLAYPGI